MRKPFRPLKSTLLPPMLLFQLVDGEELCLYMSASTTVVSVTLIRLDYDKRQKTFYFTSKALSKVET